MSEKSNSQLDVMSREELLHYCKSLQQDCLQLHDRLECAEERFQVFADNLQAAVYILDEDGKIIYGNPFLTTLSGYSKDELLQLPGFSLIHPDSRAVAVKINQARLQGDEVPAKYDLKLQVKGGKIKWVELHMASFEFQGKNFTLGTSIDITARKSSEAELRRSEEKFRDFTENLQVMVYTYNEEGKFTYANRICEEITGYSRDELLQMNLEDIFHEDYKKIARIRARQRLVSGSVNPIFHMQVVQNLVINADSEMPDGGIIKIVAENVTLDPVQAESVSLRGGSYIKMSVRDQGNGIPEELYGKIFDPFFTTRSEGSGLGLSVIYSIVKKT